MTSLDYYYPESAEHEQPLLTASRQDERGVIALLVLHVPLALAMYQSSGLATLHCSLTLVLGLWWAASGQLERALCVAAYITGAEVLWRMTHGNLLYEFGKYSTGLILITLLLSRKMRLSGLPVFYFLLLVPSMAWTIVEPQGFTARKLISFNLSGPLALALSICVLSQVTLSKQQFQRLLLILLCPTVGIAAITVFSTLGAVSIHFNTASNFVTSGGFGPNQVSAVLGLGALVAFVVLLTDASRTLKVGLFFLMLLLIAQSLMTFSRTGGYLAAAGAIMTSLYLLRDPRWRMILLLVGALLAVGLYFVVFPRLDAFTGGKLSARFQRTDLTGRESLQASDLEVWKNNLVFGVGPGMAAYRRSSEYAPLVAHTEFTRLLAEHGLWGLAAIFLLALMGRRAMKRPQDMWHKAVVVAFICWALLFMYVSAMRLVAPAFLMGLAYLTLQDEDPVAIEELELDDFAQ